MTDINDGGPAFPAQIDFRPDQNGMSPIIHDGMSLRDWFAGMALQGMLSNPKFFRTHVNNVDGDLYNSTEYNLVADEAYEAADEMLKSREIK